jgi:hypothetical protein
MMQKKYFKEKTIRLLEAHIKLEVTRVMNTYQFEYPKR